MATSHDACDDLTSAQHGLITREQALDRGVSARSIRHRLEVGTWVEVRRGLYRSAAAPQTWHQRALGACIGRAPALAVSHESAAFLHELVTARPPALDVLVGYGSPDDGLRRIATVHRSRSGVRPDEIVLVQGLRVTSVARTLADLAGTGSRVRTAELVDRALQRSRSAGQRAWLLRGLRDQASRGRAGASALREALSPWTVAAGQGRTMQSVLEARVLRILVRARVRTPQVQHPVRLPAGGAVHVDFAWPDHRVALEVDGYAFHSDRETFDYDRTRGNQLLLAGWNVLHTTATEVRGDPTALVAAVRGALDV